jgi:hypothetical protein
VLFKVGSVVVGEEKLPYYCFKCQSFVPNALLVFFILFILGSKKLALGRGNNYFNLISNYYLYRDIMWSVR